MDVDFTEHACESLRERSNIRLVWVEPVLQNPERSEPDGIDPDLEHRLGRIDEHEGRVLRVIVGWGRRMECRVGPVIDPHGY